MRIARDGFTLIEVLTATATLMMFFAAITAMI
jgi:prepilin-type N-terminal cleavage/methylation domain-containing protein